MSEYKPGSSSPMPPHEHQLFSRLGTDFHVVLFPFNFPQSSPAKKQEEGIEVVLIEDNAMDAAIIFRAIEASKYKCAPVVQANAVDAMAYLRKLSDATLADRTLILLDLILPGISGLELLSEIRRDQRLKSVPVAILTASTQARHLSASADQSVLSYMTKPNNLKQLKMFLKAFDELLGALFSPATSITDTQVARSVSPTFVGQGYEGLTRNPELR